jgi:hypothetical protein
MNRIFTQVITVTLLISVLPTLSAQVHPKEALGRKVFNSLRNQDFRSLYDSSIFSLSEQNFKFLIKNIRNQALRNDLISLHSIPFPLEAVTSQQRWEIAFKHNWRNEWRHLSRFTPDRIREQAMLPILRAVHEHSIQWKTVELIAIEILLPVTWENGRFAIKGDPDLDENSTSSRTLYIDRNLNYRLRLDNKTYAKAMMIGTKPEDSDSAYKQGILGNGTGQGDILIRFDRSTPDELFYFCPDVRAAGGTLKVLDYHHTDRPNQRHDLLLTFAYGSPLEAFQIMLPEVITNLRPNSNPALPPLPDLPIFCERPQWIGPVTLPRGLQLPY